MKEGVSKVQCLLGVEYFEISDNFIYNLRENHKRVDKVFDFLPKYTLGGNNQIVLAEYYHQFVGFEKKEKPEFYPYFNLKTMDNLLQEEIDNAGCEDLFKEENFLKHLMKFLPEKQENISNFVFPRTNYLIVELTYITSQDHHSGGYECDMEIEIVGYLSGNFSPQFFE